MASTSDAEKLAVAQAMYKALGAIVSTKDPGSLRAHIDNTMRERYETEGIDRMRLMLGGIEVGKLSVTTTKPKHETIVSVYNLNDLELWLEDNQRLAMDYALENADDFVKWVLDTDGELADGAKIEGRDTPGGAFAGTKLTGCKPEQVQAALGDNLEQAVNGLLYGEVENDKG